MVQKEQGDVMLHRPTLHRLGAWFGRFHGVDASVDLAPVSASRQADDGLPPAAPMHAAPLAATLCDVASAPELAIDLPPLPLDPHHEQALRLAAEHRWNWAQRELERATRVARDESALADLTSVREVRRQLRVLRKWPRDVPAHLALGRCYFELGLGADAEDTFHRVLVLAPEEPAAPYFLTMEYAFRGEWSAAEDCYARAGALAPDLPPFADWLNEYGLADGTAPPR